MQQQQQEKYEGKAEHRNKRQAEKAEAKREKKTEQNKNKTNWICVQLQWMNHWVHKRTSEWVNELMNCLILSAFLSLSLSLFV